MQKGFSSIFVVVALLVVVLVAGGAYYVGKSGKPRQNNIPQEVSKTSSPTSTPKQSTSSANLQVYANKKYGIEFKYPKELYVFNDPYNNPNNESQLSLNKQDCNNFQGAYCGVQDSFLFKAEPAESMTLDEWIKSKLFKKSNLNPNPSGGGFADDGEYCYSRSKQENLIVNNLNAKSFTFSWDQLGHPGKCLLNKSFNESYPDVIKEVYVTKNGWIYIFDLRYTVGSELEKTFNQILDTVQLN